ncbi:MAG: translation initiation factor IF-2 [Elusimicrobia bacterium]|jgi:translation initiation factor IF-2|nr:translation initiation factor IF-2 [Elusimicrobiota bacterium]MBK7545175.1 translation initiation factor IF-2 [Elusimicrobiota bacterium]MBK7574696.1 translation initiation factor IF-2 [Elusimicrobiota bacterium]MBK7688730.1 translation initiation factor IF-2 [Elusimicrobiota bacterium]MBK8126841.1 translation initiation factor IF-2 [Elusimicrobiota bacterium]
MTDAKKKSAPKTAKKAAAVKTPVEKKKAPAKNATAKEAVKAKKAPKKEGDTAAKTRALRKKPEAPIVAAPAAPLSVPVAAPVAATKPSPVAAPVPAAKPAGPSPTPAAPVFKPVENRPAAAAPVAAPTVVRPLAEPKPAAPVRPVPEARPAAPRIKIEINETITVKELTEKLNAKLPDVIKKLMGLGVMANLNQRLDTDTAVLVADAFNVDVNVKSVLTDEALTTPEDPGALRPRPPVVTVMGHVDHGKTSLLDAIRSARVAEKEAGGITQHIGAYQVKTDRGVVTFLDTPGHEAFTAMRARGAKATDLVILVVAADDGVMPQTVEAIDHARAADVPIVVAINKCDLPQANAQRIKQELANLNLAPEDWGGKTVMVEVSARQKTNIDKLLEMVALEAELLELKANPDRAAQGVVVEARLDPRRGPVATVLIQKGTLKLGDAFVCGVHSGKIRALTNDRGERVKEAPPSFPVEIMGLAGTPKAGDTLVVLPTEREAREIAERRQGLADAESKRARQHLTLEAFHHEATAGKVRALPIVLKADVQGSLEAIRESLQKLGNNEISVRVIHAGVGGINNSDVVLADASDAIILGFNVRPDPTSESLAQRDGVEIKTYRIIYDMVNDVKAALEGLLEPEEKEVTVGWAEVRKVFSAPKVGFVAGCMVTDGKAMRTGKARLIRNGAIVFEGALGSLKRFKDDVRDVEKGYECGLTLANFQDIKTGDRLEFFTIEKQARKL